MDAEIIAMLGQDGVTNGAIYALLALALVLVFAVTRVIFIPQGELLAWGALTMAALEAGNFPGTVWLLVGCGLLTLAVDAFSATGRRTLGRSALWNLAYPLAMAAILWLVPLASLPTGLRVILTLAIVVPMGPMLYRVAFQPVAEAPVLVLLIISVAVHLAMVGLGLLVFGPEGSRTTPFSEAQVEIGSLVVGGHTIFVIVASLVLIVGLYLFFDRTLYGKALRATAINRNGARLMGISTHAAGQFTFLLAAGIGAISGLLIGPTTTVFYDSGFLIGLKGFVAAVVAGLSSYPGALIGALFVGVVESFGSFWASAFKEVIVFTLILPVLLWRSISSGHSDEEH